MPLTCVPGGGRGASKYHQLFTEQNNRTAKNWKHTGHGPKKPTLPLNVNDTTACTCIARVRIGNPSHAHILRPVGGTFPEDCRPHHTSFGGGGGGLSEAGRNALSTAKMCRKMSKNYGAASNRMSSNPNPSHTNQTWLSVAVMGHVYDGGHQTEWGKGSPLGILPLSYSLTQTGPGGGGAKEHIPDGKWE